MKTEKVDALVMAAMADGITRSASEIIRDTGLTDADKSVRNSISRLVRANKLIHFKESRAHFYKLPPRGNTTNPFDWRTYKCPW